MTMNLRVLGVDPGIRGGLALVQLLDGNPRLIDAADVPVVGVGAKERVDALALQEWIHMHAPARAYVERGQAMPKQGASSGFKFGRAIGSIEAVVAVCAIPLEIVEPSMWKRALRLRGKDKEGARQYAIQVFPHAHHLLQRKRDHQRAEAALIALFGLRQLAPTMPTLEPPRQPQEELPL
jgi:Holliday junction resolvasome RuvABC endonuclease subunit